MMNDDEMMKHMHNTRKYHKIERSIVFVQATFCSEQSWGSKNIILTK